VSVGSASPDLPGRPGEWLVASDLDQTLIFSRRRCALNPHVAVTPVEDLDGQPISFSTPRSLRLLAALTETATFVPVTTRTRAQFARVRLGLAAPLAITTNGGALLVDGQPDEEWTAGVHERIAACARPVAAVAALARRLAEQDWVRVTAGSSTWSRTSARVSPTWRAWPRRWPATAGACPSRGARSILSRRY
jgi:hypothetical protein